MHQKPTDEQLANRYTHHAPFGDQAIRYGAIRGQILATAKICRDLTPCSPEQTRALNALDEAMMLFNAAIARNEKPPEQAAGITSDGLKAMGNAVKDAISLSSGRSA